MNMKSILRLFAFGVLASISWAADDLPKDYKSQICHILNAIPVSKNSPIISFYKPTRAVLRNADGPSRETWAVLIKMTPRDENGSILLLTLSRVFIWNQKSRAPQEVHPNIVEWPHGEPKQDNP